MNAAEQLILLGGTSSASGSEGIWTPAQLFSTGTNIAYYDAATVGNALDTFKDSSGKGNDATQATSGNRFDQITTRVNGKACYTVNSSVNTKGGFNLPAPFSVNLRNHTWFILCRSRSGTLSGDRTMMNFGPTLTTALSDVSDQTNVGRTIRSFSGSGAFQSNLIWQSNPMLIVCRANAAGVRYRINGAEETLTAFPAGSVTGGTMLIRQDNNFGIGGEVYLVGILDRVLTDQEITQLETYAQSFFNRTWASLTKGIMVVGDSLSESQNAVTCLSWASLLDDDLGATWRQISRAQAGQSTASETTGGITGGYNGAYTKNVLIDFMGLNDVRASTANATIMTNKKAWWSAWKAKGASAKVVVCTIPKSGDATGLSVEANRVALNALINAEVGVTCDAVADVAGMSQLSDPNNTTYFAVDKIHWQDGTFALAKDVIKTAVLSV